MNRYAGLKSITDKEAAIAPWLSKTHLPTVRKGMAMTFEKLRSFGPKGKFVASEISNNPESMIPMAIAHLTPIPFAGPIAAGTYIAGKKGVLSLVDKVKQLVEAAKGLPKQGTYAGLDIIIKKGQSPETGSALPGLPPASAGNAMGGDIPGRAAPGLMDRFAPIKDLKTGVKSLKAMPGLAQYQKATGLGTTGAAIGSGAYKALSGDVLQATQAGADVATKALGGVQTGLNLAHEVANPTLTAAKYMKNVGDVATNVSKVVGRGADIASKITQKGETLANVAGQGERLAGLGGASTSLGGVMAKKVLPVAAAAGMAAEGANYMFRDPVTGKLNTDVARNMQARRDETLSQQGPANRFSSYTKGMGEGMAHPVATTLTAAGGVSDIFKQRQENAQAQQNIQNMEAQLTAKRRAMRHQMLAQQSGQMPKTSEAFENIYKTAGGLRKYRS